MAIAYRRILLKLSGEALMGPQKGGICANTCRQIALAIKALHLHHIQVCLVIGGGNIFRGIQAGSLGIERTPADQMGMLATIINGIALQQTLEACGCPVKVFSALSCPQVVDTFRLDFALEALEQEKVLIFVGGTGHPYFTTDTAAALRASEMKVDALLKATKVDGIYNKDPMKYHDAIKYDTITYAQALAENLEVMDATSIALCMSNNIPIWVFNMQWLDEKHIVETLAQQKGTLVTNHING